ncbi:MAG: extracellular solute-binding protein, partial [Chitinophagales bacterium]
MKSSFLLLPLILLFLGSCNSDNNNSKQSDTASDAVVNVYSHRHYTSDEKLYKAFEAETGIKVKLVKASADQLLERIKMEGENSPADLIITIDAGRLWRAKDAGLLQAIESAEIMDQIDPLFRDKEKQWVGLTYRSRVFVVHKDRIEGLDLLKTYDGLAHPKFKGRVLVRSSENLYNQSLLSALIAHKGEANALNWTKQVVENMARKPKGNDTDQLKSVAAGIG